jgi:hypothetical protein
MSPQLEKLVSQAAKIRGCSRNAYVNLVLIEGATLTVANAKSAKAEATS